MGPTNIFLYKQFINLPDECLKIKLDSIALYEVIVQIGTKSISFPNKLCRNSLKEKEDII